MKMTKLQIVILLLVFWAYTNGGSGILPLPKPNYTPDLRDEDLEAKVLAAMIVIADDHTPKSVNSVETEVAQEVAPPIIEEPEEVMDNLFPGRFPRAIVLTDGKNCAPCKDYKRETLDIFTRGDWGKSGWTMGPDKDKMIEVVDLIDEKKFYEYFDKLNTIKDIEPSVPTTVFLDYTGKVIHIKSGKIEFSEFVKLAKSGGV